MLFGLNLLVSDSLVAISSYAKNHFNLADSVVQNVTEHKSQKSHSILKKIIHTFNGCLSATRVLWTLHLAVNTCMFYMCFVWKVSETQSFFVFFSNITFIFYYKIQKNLEKGHRANWLTLVEQAFPHNFRPDGSVSTLSFFSLFPWQRWIKKVISGRFGAFSYINDTSCVLRSCC